VAAAEDDVMSEVQGDLPWIVGLFAAIVFFAIFETKAFRFPQSTNTLSHAVYTIGSKWPLSIFLMGMFCGGLAVHFFWHWCPAGSVSTGMLRTILGG
jgi:hypothetical protein